MSRASYARQRNARSPMFWLGVSLMLGGLLIIALWLTGALKPSTKSVPQREIPIPPATTLPTSKSPLPALPSATPSQPAQPGPTPLKPTIDPSKIPAHLRSGDQTAKDAFTAKRSGDKIMAIGKVVKILPDKTLEDKFQCLSVKLRNDLVVTVYHSLDISKRVPVAEGDDIEFSGVYEWSDEGGDIRWTHSDPAKVHPDGWIRYLGKTYQ